MSRKIYIITGDIETGKTTWLQGAIDFLKSEDKVAAGVITPGIWKDGNKLGIDAVLLPKAEKFSLAIRNENNSGFSKKWEFNETAIKKVNDYFTTLKNFDYLVVDELGPLEIEKGEGFTNAVKILVDGFFDKAIIVIRPHLIDKAKVLFNNHEIVIIDNLNSKNYSLLV